MDSVHITNKILRLIFVKKHVQNKYFFYNLRKNAIENFKYDVDCLSF